MKKLINVAVIVAVGLAISGCSLFQKEGKFDITGAQQLAIKICSYVPTAQTVLNIFNTGSGALDTASEVASAICNAVNTPRSAGQKPVVAGVVVEGRKL